MIQETPVNFQIEKRFENTTVRYEEVTELCQGGPEVGYLSINGNRFSADRFAGPMLLDGGYLYAPMYIKKWLSSGFQLTKIDLKTLEIGTLSELTPLIHLVKIDGQNICYFDSLDQINLKKLQK